MSTFSPFSSGGGVLGLLGFLLFGSMGLGLMSFFSAVKIPRKEFIIPFFLTAAPSFSSSRRMLSDSFLLGFSGDGVGWGGVGREVEDGFSLDGFSSS